MDLEVVVRDVGLAHLLRRMTRTAESTCGGGRNARRGSVRPTVRLNLRVAPGAYLRATARCSTRSAAISLLRTLLAPGSKLIAADLVLQRAVARKYASGATRRFSLSVGLTLPRRAFLPPPHVDSAVLVIRRSKRPPP